MTQRQPRQGLALSSLDSSSPIDAGTCADCGHRAHHGTGVSGGGCNGWISNGWTQHGCHCTTTTPTGGRDYLTTVNAEGDEVPEHPMLCADCGAPVFYADDQYWHAVSDPDPACFGPMSWIAGNVDDPQHPAYAAWRAGVRVGKGRAGEDDES